MHGMGKVLLMKIWIDQQQIEAKEGSSVLEAALEAGIFIPHICKHPDLEAAGGCRLCVVEKDGKVLPSCQMEVEEGLKVSLRSEKAKEVRNMAMELILATHPPDCTGCPKYGKCELQSMYQYMGVSPEKWRLRTRSVPTDTSNPLITHMFTRCIRCARCIRACRGLRGVRVLDFQKTEGGIRVGTDGSVSLEEAGCRFCGACIEVCPTGSIIDSLEASGLYGNREDNTVPCRAACPAGIDIPRYIRAIRLGDFSKAAAIAREKVPFPEILGSVCVHPCEQKCKRGILGEPMSICRLKRAAGANDDRSWKKRIRQEERTGKKAAVVGAGPAGLTAAYYLAKKGHEVTVFEENKKAGGQCRYGIPAYRLPDELLDKEIADILEEGVRLVTGQRIESAEALLKEGFDSVLLAGGTHAGIRLELEGNRLPGVVLNTDFLKEARENPTAVSGGDLMVLGGGNVAYDCARTALRLGYENVYLVCLEGRENMLASEEEIEEGKEEGVQLFSGHSFLRITGSDRAEGVEVAAVTEYSFDENRRATITIDEDTKRIIPVSTVVFAVGQRPKDSDKYGVDLERGLYVKINENFETSLNGIFGVGDIVTGTRSVIEAIAAARKAAVRMDLFLGGDGDISEVLTEKEVPDSFIGRWEKEYSSQRREPKRLSAAECLSGFHLAEEALELETAKEEAMRCLQCDLRLSITRPKLWTEYQEAE